MPDVFIKRMQKGIDDETALFNFLNRLDFVDYIRMVLV